METKMENKMEIGDPLGFVGIIITIVVPYSLYKYSIWDMGNYSGPCSMMAMVHQLHTEIPCYLISRESEEGVQQTTYWLLPDV